MRHKVEPREKEFLKTIKSLERQKSWLPFVMVGLMVLVMWTDRENIFERSMMQIGYPMLILIGLIGVSLELINVKILLIKAEYRDWLREFGRERWESVNNE